MRVLLALVFAAIVAIAYQQCVETEITNTLQGIDKALHTIHFLVGGTVRYNLTQTTLYKDQTINVALVNGTAAPFQHENDACDFNSTRASNPQWTDNVGPFPGCDRAVVSALSFRNQFVNCKNLQQSTEVISGNNYDVYTGVFAAQLVNPVGTVQTVDIYRTTFIKTRFSIKLQKDIQLTTTLNITAPQNVFSAGAVIQTFNYESNRVEIGFFTTQSTSAAYSLQRQSNAPGPHPAIVKGSAEYTTPTFSCPAGLPNCQTWVLEINPESECSWQGQAYEARFNVECGGCLLQSNEVVVQHSISLSDICDIVELQFDVTGSVSLFANAARDTAIAQPVSINTPAFVRANLQTTFAPMIDVNLRRFRICTYTSAENCDAAPNTIILVNNNVATATGNLFNVNPTDLSTVPVTTANSVNYDFDMEIVFQTGGIEQSHLNSNNGQLLFEFDFDVQYVNKKKRTSLSAKSTNNVETEAVSVPATGFTVAPNLDNNNSASLAQASSLVVLAIVSLFFFFF